MYFLLFLLYFTTLGLTYVDMANLYPSLLVLTFIVHLPTLWGGGGRVGSGSGILLSLPPLSRPPFTQTQSIFLYYKYLHVSTQTWYVWFGRDAYFAEDYIENLQ